MILSFVNSSKNPSVLTKYNPDATDAKPTAATVYFFKL